MTFRSCLPVWLIFFVIVIPVSAHAQEPFDLLFTNGEVLDGTGAAAFRADVGIRGARIAAVGDLDGASARRVIDVSGRTIVPGFIDLHSHADGASESGLRSRDGKRRAAPNIVAQGVTTVVVNQDGRSPRQIGRQREQLESGGIGPNAILMVGHNTVRGEVMSSEFRRAAETSEIEEMRALVHRGMEEGAWGLTAGLEYAPGIWSTTEELIALVEAVRPHGGIYIVHERSSGADPMWYLPSQDPGEPSTMLDNIMEQISIAEKTEVTTVATHIKARGVGYWGKSGEMVEVIQAARDRGVPIFADQYPYTTSGSDGAISLIPRWLETVYRDTRREGPRDYGDLLKRAMRDRGVRKKLLADVHHEMMRRGGPEQIVVMDYPDGMLIGKTLSEAAEAADVHPVRMVLKFQLEGYTNRLGGARLRGYSMSEEDIERFAAQSWVATASDGNIALLDDSWVHARYYGTFPRKIREYAMKRGVLSVEAAVRSMTSLPAEILGMKNRGVIEEGNAADLAVLDLSVLEDTATFFYPHQYPKGIEYVLVNGVFAVDEGTLTLTLPGKVLTPADH